MTAQLYIDSVFRIQYGVECKVKWTFHTAADCQRIIVGSSANANCTTEDNEFCQVRRFKIYVLFQTLNLILGSRLWHTTGELLLAQHGVDRVPLPDICINCLILGNYTPVNQTQPENGSPQKPNRQKLAVYNEIKVYFYICDIKSYAFQQSPERFGQTQDITGTNDVGNVIMLGADDPVEYTALF